MSANTVKHTPGPWVLCAHLADHDQCSCGYRGGIWSGDGETIVCEMGGPSGAPGDEMIPRADRQTQFADARLIAAAPDMLEALEAQEAALAFLESYDRNMDMNPERFREICDELYAQAEAKSKAALLKAHGTSTPEAQS